MSIFWNLMLTILGLLLLREAYIFLSLHKYRKNKRNIVFYRPTIVQIMNIVKSISKGDIFKFSRENFIKEDLFKYDLVISNHYIKPRALININSGKAIQEFYKKEADFTKKIPPLDEKYLGFFFMDYKKGKKLRNKFSKLFMIENIKKLIPGIKLSVRKHVEKLRKEVYGYKGNGIKVNLKDDFFKFLFKDLSSRIILGKDNDQVEKINGGTLVENSQKMVDYSFKASFSPIKLLSFGLAEKLGFLPYMKEMKDHKEYINRGVKNIYIEREKEIQNRSEERIPCLLDNIIEFNNDKMKKEDEKMSFEEIGDNFSLFLFASNDTSTQTSTNTLGLLAKNPKEQNNLFLEINQKIKSPDYTFDDIMQFDYLTAVFKESLRLIPPAASLTERLVAKDMKICDTIIKKGDGVMVFFMALGMDPRYFENPMKFDPNRFRRENKEKDYPEIPKFQQIPFSYGERGCIGQVLAEVMVKIILIEFLKVFELRTVDGWEMKLGIGPAYGITNGEFIISRRRG